MKVRHNTRLKKKQRRNTSTNTFLGLFSCGALNDDTPKRNKQNMKNTKLISLTSASNTSGENGAYDVVLLFLRQTMLEVPMLALCVQLLKLTTSST